MSNTDKLLLQLKPEALPVFNKTVQAILNITRNEGSSSADLSSVVLRDPSMTAHLLHVANRIPYNPSINAIATVSQAVLVLGFETISRLALTKAVIDSLLQGNAQQYLLDLISQSLHAAVQAHAIARSRGDTSPEDVFIATLLKRIGDIALWSLSPEASQRVAEHLEAGMTLGNAQRREFGCTGLELTGRLSTEWSLGELLTEAVLPEGSRDPRVHLIETGEAVARAAATGDPDALEREFPRVKRALGSASRVNPKRLLSSSTSEARAMAKHYGLPTSSILDLTRPELEDEPAWLNPDPDFRLKMLDRISKLLEGKPDINRLFELAAEGIYHGAGMDTVLLALNSRDVRALGVRFVLSLDSRAVPAKSSLRIQDGGILDECLRAGEAIWYPETSRAPVEPLLRHQSRGHPFFLKSIALGSRPLGVFYADRAGSGRALDAEAFGAFRQFCQQANLGLSFLKSR